MQFREWLERQNEAIWSWKKPPPAAPSVYHKDPVTGEIRPGPLPDDALRTREEIEAAKNKEQFDILWPYDPSWMACEKAYYDKYTGEQREAVWNHKKFGTPLPGGLPGWNYGPSNAPPRRSIYHRQTGVHPYRRAV